MKCPHADLRPQCGCLQKQCSIGMLTIGMLTVSKLTVGLRTISVMTISKLTWLEPVPAGAVAPSQGWSSLSC